MKCMDCGEPVRPGNAWTEVKGFDQPRNQGGTNYVALRTPTGRLLCNGCMTLRRSHVHPEQATLA